MTPRPTATSSALMVYDEQRAIGFILRCGPADVEAFTADDNSLGVFRNEHDAASAIWRAARGQPTRGVACDREKRARDSMNCADDFISYLLAEFRCAAQRAKLAADDLVAISLALKGGLITPYQAILHVEETDAFRFLGRLSGENWGPEWGESARQYHEDRKRSTPKPAQPKAPASWT